MLLDLRTISHAYVVKDIMMMAKMQIVSNVPISVKRVPMQKIVPLVIILLILLEVQLLLFGKN